jgi:hypothetical protein
VIVQAEVLITRLSPQTIQTQQQEEHKIDQLANDQAEDELHFELFELLLEFALQFDCVTIELVEEEFSKRLHVECGQQTVRVVFH